MNCIIGIDLLFIPAILTPYSGEIDPLRFLGLFIKERL
jgi:hypothetical protein